MTTIPVLDPVTDINDSDLVMVTNAQGLSYTINGAELEKRNKIIIASNTTVTGAPLKAGRSVRIYFSADITANDGNTVMQINYNGVNYYVKAPKDGALSNFVAHAVGNTYKYVQAHTTLEFLVIGNQQDGFQFVIIGNPVVISNSDYSIQADGSIEQREIYRTHGNSSINLNYYLQFANRVGMNGLKVTYYNLGNDSTKYTIVYVIKYSDSWHLLKFYNLPYDFLINGNNLQCQALYPEQSDWTIEFWSGRNS